MSGEGNLIFVSNHTSLADTLFLMSFIPFSGAWKVKPIASSALLKIPMLGNMMKATGVLPIQFKQEKTDSENMSVDTDKAKETLHEAESYI